MVQADRGARPSQSVFLTGDEKGAYMEGEPKDDSRFVKVFAHSLEHTGGYTSADATRVAADLCRTYFSLIRANRRRTHTMDGLFLTT